MTPSKSDENQGGGEPLRVGNPSLEVPSGIPVWLEIIRSILPPQEIILVGAGDGRGSWAQWVKESRSALAGIPIHLVEGDKTKFLSLQRVFQSDQNTQLRCEVVSPNGGPATFYRVSVSHENSLIPAYKLRKLWPNLTLVDSHHVTAAPTIDSLLNRSAGNTNWLLLDCLPAAGLLLGGAQLLRNLDVALIRVTDDIRGLEQANEDAVDSIMTRAGLRRVHRHVERHPSLAHVLYVRDTANPLRALTATLEEARAREASNAAALQAAHEKWAQERNRLKKAYAEQRDLLAEARRRQDEVQSAAEAIKAELRGRREEWSEEREHLRQKHSEAREQIQKKSQKIESIRRRLASAEQENETLKKRVGSEANRATGDDADIDNFLNDLAPFLYGRSITYVDVGAYEGMIPLKISKHGKINLREAHLFEPNPESFKRLRDNIQTLKLAKLRLYNQALGSQKSRLKFSSEKSMTRVMPDSASAENHPNTFVADCTRLDDVSANFTDGRIDLLKIDVEGFEMEVIEGAKELLNDQRVDVVYIEVGFNKSGTQQTYFASLDSRLQDLGYRVFRIYEQMNEWILDSPLLRRCNFAYMSEAFARSKSLKIQSELLKTRS